MCGAVTVAASGAAAAFEPRRPRATLGDKHVGFGKLRQFSRLGTFVSMVRGEDE
jgi:hypothetical protein